jgi:hypothetical protein
MFNGAHSKSSTTIECAPEIHTLPDAQTHVKMKVCLH